MITDSKVAAYAKNDEEIRDKWRKRIKYDLLVLKSDKTERPEAKEKLQRRYHSFAKRMNQTDSDELLEMYLTRHHHQLRSAHHLHVAQLV